MEVTLCERTFAQGKNRFKVNSKDQWQVLMWGWHLHGSSPRYQWEWIEEKHVPKEILKKAGMI